MKRVTLLEQFQEKILNATDCIGEETFDTALAEMKEATALVSEMEKTRATINEMKSNFGVAYNLICSNMSTLVKEEKEFLKEWFSLLKNDKNLRGEVLFYESLRRYKPEIDATEYLTESLAMCESYIDKGTIKESLARVANLIGKSEIVFENTLAENTKLDLYNKCQTLLETKQDHNSLTTLFEARKAVAGGLNEIADEAAVAINNIKSTKLTTEEAALVKMFAGSEEEKQNLFETLRNECLARVDEKLAVCTDETDLAEYKEIKAVLNEKKYSVGSYFTDITKFLDALDVITKN